MKMELESLFVTLWEQGLAPAYNQEDTFSVACSPRAQPCLHCPGSLLLSSLGLLCSPSISFCKQESFYPFTFITQLTSKEGTEKGKKNKPWNFHKRPSRSQCGEGGQSKLPKGGREKGRVAAVSRTGRELAWGGRPCTDRIKEIINVTSAILKQNKYSKVSTKPCSSAVKQCNKRNKSHQQKLKWKIIAV